MSGGRAGGPAPGANGAEGVERAEAADGTDGTDRVRAARRVLEEAGIRAPVRAVGADGEIVAVTGPPTLRERLARLAPELQALGFRYVALEPRDGPTPTQDS
ncbi:MAG: hypothetical protein ACOCUW_02180 [Gemmatimonadota bacterium]